MGASTTNRVQAPWWSIWVTAALAMGAVSLIPWLLMALQVDDVEALESPLVLAAARQLESTPCELYGPYDAGNRLVLIHAPLYYRATGLLAWPLYRAGVNSVVAALAAGRLLSLAGLAAALAAVFLLARLAGAPPIAGWWAALLAAATPVYGGLHVEVRPDLAGIGLQTIGVLVLLKERILARPRARKLFVAFLCFALAACIKQHFVAVAAVSACLLFLDCRRGRLSLRALAGILLPALGIVAAYYAVEDWLTSGYMSRSVFAAAARAASVHPATWFAALNILLGVVWKSVGLILLAAAAGLQAVSARPGLRSKTFVAAATVMVSAVALLAIVQLFAVRMWLSTTIVLGLVVILTSIIPAAGLASRRRAAGPSLGAVLLAFLAAEIVLIAGLCKLSTGAWYNYAIQAVMFAAVLVARSLAPGSSAVRSQAALVAAALAAAAVPAFAWTDAKEVLARRQNERVWTQRLLESLKRPPDQLFFLDRPGDNRIHGRRDLVFDPWLYPVFESSGQAAPREEWLAGELAAGSVRVVVANSPRPEVSGVSRSLRELGYHKLQRFGPYWVWMRDD
jgi:hypothetical protein